MISVIVPVYNRLELLKKTLDSISAQTYKDVEVIVVDDGSTEEWPSVIARRPFADEAISLSDDLDCRVARTPARHASQLAGVAGRSLLAMTVIHQSNKGAPAARNRGLAEAKGEYVSFWGCGGVALPQMLEKLKSALDKHSQASYAYSFNFTYHVSIN